RLINRSTAPKEGGAENGSSSTTLLVPSRHGYKYFLPNRLSILCLTLSFRLKGHSKALPLIFRRSFFHLVVSEVAPSNGRRNLLAIRRRSPNASNHRITSESSYTSPIDTDDNRPFKPDSSKTDLTEPEYSPRAGRTITRKKPHLTTGIKSLLIPEDYGRSNKTKKLKLRLKEPYATSRTFIKYYCLYQYTSL
ncbi:hypothetical protein N7530_006267, partial [Penicillium desertorum]